MIMTSSSLLSLFTRSSILFFLLVIYLRSWNFFLNVQKPHERHGEWYHFATFWNLYLQTVYACVAFVGTLVELVSRKELVKGGLLEKFMTHLICPMTVFVVAAFWALFLYKPSLVRQEGYHVPDWFNHAIHSYVIVLPLSEFFFLPQTQHKVYRTILYMSTVSLCYWVWMEYLAHNQIFPYPLYRKLELDQRIMVNLFFLIFVVPVCCCVGYILRGIVHRMKAA